MEKVIKITGLRDQQNDFNYWQSRSDVDRLHAIEMLRQQYINFQQDVQPRLQRVYRIINKK